jgi:hypothetical protein
MRQRRGRLRIAGHALSPLRRGGRSDTTSSPGTSAWKEGGFARRARIEQAKGHRLLQAPKQTEPG